MAYLIERLSETHSVGSFDCGVERKNIFLSKFALQNSKGGLGRTYVAIESENREFVAGYYTISSGSVRFESIPKANLPRYPIPSILLGKLAIDTAHQGKGLGSALLFDALKRSSYIADEIGIFLIEVKALDETAKAFYLKHEFVEMANSNNNLFISMKKVRKLLAAK